MEWLEWFKALVLILSVCSSIIIAVVNSIRGKGKVKGAEAKAILISELIPAAVVKSEKIGVSGEVKKTIAISNIMIECAARGINFNEFTALIEEEIEKLIATTKSVNAKTKNY